MRSLQLYRELGGRILTIGSDSHRKEHLGAFIKDTMEEAKKLGDRADYAAVCKAAACDKKTASEVEF